MAWSWERRLSYRVFVLSGDILCLPLRLQKRCWRVIAEFAGWRSRNAVRRDSFWLCGIGLLRRPERGR